MDNYTNSTHYPYINYTPHLLGYGETPDYTLVSPLFQSIANRPDLMHSILNSFYSDEYINAFMERAEQGEMEEEGVYDYADAIAYLYIQLQNACKHLTFINTETGEVVAEIEITPKTLDRTVGELLPSGSPVLTGTELKAA